MICFQNDSGNKLYEPIVSSRQRLDIRGLMLEVAACRAMHEVSKGQLGIIIGLQSRCQNFPARCSNSQLEVLRDDAHFPR